MQKSRPPAVLIVEDEPLILMAAADVIAAAGLQACEAGDADEALQVLHDHPEVGILFTDINMPGSMDGLELAVQVHDQRPEVELIVTTGATNVKDADLPDHGTFLQKPYQSRQLAEIVRDKVVSSETKRSPSAG